MSQRMVHVMIWNILPYPVTSYDAIFTTIINFQDALKQKGYTVG